VIAHIVLFEPKSAIPAPSKKEFLEEIRSVTRNIPHIKQARIGKTISFGVTPENKMGQKAYQYAAVFEFETLEDFEAYLVHPSHDRLRSIFWDLCEASLITDVELFDPSASQADNLV
jgi:hypothetical protein